MRKEIYRITNKFFDLKTRIVYFCTFHSILYNICGYLLFFPLVSDRTNTVRLLLVRIRFLVVTGDRTTVNVEPCNQSIIFIIFVCS